MPETLKDVLPEAAVLFLLRLERTRTRSWRTTQILKKKAGRIVVFSMWVPSFTLRYNSQSAKSLAPGQRRRKSHTWREYPSPMR